MKGGEKKIDNRRKLIAGLVLAVCVIVLNCVVLYHLHGLRTASSVLSNKDENHTGVNVDTELVTPRQRQATNSDTDEPSATSEHQHIWVNGICEECGAKCSHRRHDQNGICLDCKTKRFHKYLNGICSCGKPLEFKTSALPDEYYTECEHAGTLTDVVLSGMLDQETPATKTTQIYLPYNYDPQQKYDVLFLEGGLGNPYNACVGKKWIANDSRFSMSDIFDHMIENGECAPFIAVGVDGYSQTPQNERALDGYVQTAYFLRTVIYPYVIENYSTYAASILQKDIQAARSHFGLGGFSNGGYLAYWGGMNTMLDICANFVPMAGSIRPGEVARSVMANKDLYRIECLYSGAGVSDGAAYNRTKDEYESLVSNVDYLIDGENAWFGSVEGGHDWLAASILLWNALSVMFPNTPSAL